MLLVLPQHYVLGINNTQSLPRKIYFIHKNKMPGPEGYVVFTKDTQGILPSGTQFIKQVVGVAGDVVRIENATAYINDKCMGKIKAKTKEGKRLSAGYTGEIPKGFAFVWTSHTDSFDSRYAQMGLIHEDEIIGVAYPLW